MTLKCKQHMGHNAMYWYMQSAQEPPKLMFGYSDEDLFQNETASSRFSPQRTDDSQLELKGTF